MATITEPLMFTEEELFEAWLMPLLVHRNQERERSKWEFENNKILEESNSLPAWFKRD